MAERYTADGATGLGDEGHAAKASRTEAARRFNAGITGQALWWQ
jgi:hypothetical protein